MSEENIKNDSVEVAETETPEVEVNHVGSMIDNLDAGDNVAAQDAFKNALTDKIGQALDDKRMTVANDWLNAGDTLQAAHRQDGEGRRERPRAARHAGRCYGGEEACAGGARRPMDARAGAVPEPDRRLAVGRAPATDHDAHPRPGA